MTCFEACKEELACAIDKWLWDIINIMLFKTAIALRNERIKSL